MIDNFLEQSEEVKKQDQHEEEYEEIVEEGGYV